LISRNTIDRIFEAVHIEEVVADFVQLKKAGSNLKGLSPWTDEKTPSFFVSPSKGIFKDFSSGKGGNAVTFLMELEHMSYPEALRYLAEKYSIEVEETGEDPKDKEEQSLRESLALVNKFALETFSSNLHDTEEGRSIGLSYFRERGFSDKTIAHFGLGYALDRSTDFTEKAKAAGHKEDHLLKLGLTKEGNYGKYDFFRGRVIFPIRNISGRCIAFAGRTLKSDNKVKYINSPESELYDKSKVLYGLYEGKQSIIKEDRCFLVEGYTDVISLHQAGIGYAVASSGTSLTPDQAKLIKRYTKNVSVLYDGDTAGINAALRGIDLLLEAGLQVRVVLFPEGHDPDSFAQSVSQSELEDYLEKESKDFSDFMVEVLLAGHEDDPIRKAEATRRVVESLAFISDQITRSIYIERCSKRLGIPEKALLNELNKLLRKRHLKRAGVDPEIIQEQEKKRDTQGLETAEEDPVVWEREISRVLLSYCTDTIRIPILNEDEEEDWIEVMIGEYILHDLHHDEIEFTSGLYARIVAEFRKKFEEEEAFPTVSELIKDPELSEAVAEMITSPYELSRNWSEKHNIYTDTEETDLKRTVIDPLMRLKLNRIKTMSKEVDNSIKSASSEDELNLHLQQKIRLDDMKIEVSKFFGTSII
jgi:DNA primase